MRLAFLYLVLLLLSPMPAIAQLAGGATGGGSWAPVGAADAGLPAGFNPASDFVAQGGLAVRVLFVGRSTDGKQLTVSTQLVNSAEQPLNVALIGPKPTAIDTRGVQYKLANIAGIGRCRELDYEWVNRCMNNTKRGSSHVLQNSHFAHLQPGATTIMALTFSSASVSETGFMSISMNFAVGQGDRVTDENRKELRNFPITFPIVDLAAASTGQ